jgi:hypothetical protein
MPDFALTTTDPTGKSLRLEGGAALRVSELPFAQSAGTGSSFVYRPGGTPAPGVYTTSAALKAALLTVDEAAAKVITIDATTAQLNAADSPWPLNNATFVPGQGACVLTLQAGLTLAANVARLSARAGVGIAIDAASAAIMWQVPTIAILELVGSTFANPSATAFANVASGVTLLVVKQTGTLSQGTLAKIQSGGTVQDLSLDGSATNAAAYVSGTVAGGTLTSDLDPSSAQLVTAQTDVANLTFTQLLLDTAANTTQASGNTGTGTGTASFVTGNIAQKRAGSKMLVTATISGVTTSATTVTLQLKRDGASGTSIGNSVAVITLSAGDGFSGTLCFIDTPPDTATHTYALVATAGAGNLTVATNNIQIAVAEVN